MFKKALAIALVVTLSGCTYLRQKTMPRDMDLLSGPASLFDEKKTADAILQKYGYFDASGQYTPIQEDAVLDGNQEKHRRNSLQDELIALSNERCNHYKRVLMSAKNQASVLWGSTSLLMSGAGAIVSHAPTANAFSGVAAAATGINSEYDKAYFNELSVNVIISGIDKKRGAVLDQIRGEQDKGLVKYSAQRAISEVLEYHGACSAVAGLSAAGTSLQKISKAQLIGD
ncbi:hypothetical protein [Microbulbifer rhizosphaerae]|uniref:Uncharacterized protein YceK n=1 Tax=Microbulbifer rhizosphaerae TaxID=1562603 RepID=A0A7W4Z8J6_9GAMM|nr:hypothetical protein [Microbulbifer rhizosphaerae]MBB3060657.1 uncharacterized protein YceK [Microbulbifer rhizosphaerae]